MSHRLALESADAVRSVDLNQQGGGWKLTRVGVGMRF